MFMSTITLESRITNNNINQPMKKSHIHLKSPGILNIMHIQDAYLNAYL
jgi:hypothetical protein